MPYGSLYECTDHDKVYITDGAAWTDYVDHSDTGTAAVTSHASSSRSTAAPSPARSESNVTTLWCSLTCTVATVHPVGRSSRQGT